MFNAAQTPEMKASILTDMIRERSVNSLDKKALQTAIQAMLHDLQTATSSVDRLITLGSLAKIARIAKNVSPVIGKLLRKTGIKLDGSLAELNDADQRYYAAIALEWFDKREFLPFSAFEAIREDTGEKVRSELVTLIFAHSDTLEEAFLTLNTGVQNFHQRQYGSPDVKTPSETSLNNRFRRVFNCIDETLKTSTLPAGSGAGLALAQIVGKAFGHLAPSTTAERWPAADAAIALLQTYLRSHFSVVVEATSYATITQIKSWFKSEDWLSYCSESGPAKLLKNDIEEALILLARFGRADNDMMDCFILIQGNRDKAKESLAGVVDKYPDIPSGLHEWLSNAGVVKVRSQKTEELHNRSIEQQTDNLLADLLLQAGLLSPRLKVFAEDAMTTLNMFNPGTAGQVQFLLNSNREMLMTLRSLVTARHLRAKGQIHDILEFQASEHEVAGGHKTGIRKVKVVRPAVERRDGSKISIVRKALVEAVDSGEGV